MCCLISVQIEEGGGGKKKEKEHSTSTFKKEPFILKQGNGKHNASYK